MTNKGRANIIIIVSTLLLTVGLIAPPIGRYIAYTVIGILILLGTVMILSMIRDLLEHFLDVLDKESIGED